MMAITADYRVKSRHGVQVVECVKDAKAAIAWVRENARRLGIDPDKIAASGGSAGGHLAASTGTISGIGSDERPNAMILFNPGCTLAPIAGWQPPAGAGARLGIERLGVEAEVISPAHHRESESFGSKFRGPSPTQNPRRFVPKVPALSGTVSR